MAISKTPQQEPFPLRNISELQPAVSRYSAIPTAESVKATKLFGIPLKSSLTGETLSDETIEFYINSAISELEHTLDISITPVQYYEKHDYASRDFTWSYNFMHLDHSPILYVEKVELSFTNDVNVPGFVNFPLEHVHVMGQEGTVQLVPAFGSSIGGFLLSAFSGAQFHALRAAGVSTFPGGIRVQYVAGFPIDKVPYMISQLISVLAAMNILSALGPVLFPNTSTSISIDSVSQSVGTLGPNFLNTRMQQLTEERDRLLVAAKSYYIKSFMTDMF